ncbi:MAG: phosphopantothenoylcysteine decarboxylase domain-containing protein [Solirubrobacteraceae bacterium]
MSPGALRNRRVVVTAGGTREPIDPVRYLGNRSSGRMGNALALEAQARGADVVLVTTVAAPSAPGLHVVPVCTADEMHDAVRTALAGAAVLVMAAAVADYRPAAVSARKMKKRASLTLELVPTVDILRSLRDDPLRDGLLVVGFAAETDDLEENARRKLLDKGLDVVVLNDVGRADIGMGSDHNAVTIIGADGERVDVSRRPKTEVAVAVMDAVERRLR